MRCATGRRGGPPQRVARGNVADHRYRSGDAAGGISRTLAAPSSPVAGAVATPDRRGSTRSRRRRGWPRIRLLQVGQGAARERFVVAIGFAGAGDVQYGDGGGTGDRPSTCGRPQGHPFRADRWRERPARAAFRTPGARLRTPLAASTISNPAPRRSSLRARPAAASTSMESTAWDMVPLKTTGSQDIRGRRPGDSLAAAAE